MKSKGFLKKLLCLVLAVLLAVGLVGCASEGTQVSAVPSPTPTVTEAPPAVNDGGETTETPQPTAAAPPIETDFPEPVSIEEPTPEPTAEQIRELAEDGTYTSADDVALYILEYGKLPSNFITKKQAKQLGWSGGGLEKYAPGKSIGGDRFGNYEKLLPEKKGRIYTECDIDTMGASSRGAKRLVFSNDGLIFYTEDHYQSFVLLFEEGSNESGSD